ncbi:MAG: hypothetical protein JXA10_14840, partial [Anaerolineae bacterium]|nr:hypothetical protein [Anaerolineae bacterium]
VPPHPLPLYQGDGYCLAWDGVTWYVYGGGQLLGYLWFYDVFIPICPMGPENWDYSDSVVGTFVDNTELLQWPDSTQGIGVVMEAGKTAWVHGVDESGMYFQISQGAGLAWVPVSSMTPNYDDVWNGTPLIVPIIELPDPY